MNEIVLSTALLSTHKHQQMIDIKISLLYGSSHVMYAYNSYLVEEYL